VAAAKMDAMQNPERLERLRTFCEQQGLPLIPISSVTGAGISELKYFLGSRLREARESAVEAP